MEGVLSVSRLVATLSVNRVTHTVMVEVKSSGGESVILLIHTASREEIKKAFDLFSCLRGHSSAGGNNI